MQAIPNIDDLKRHHNYLDLYRFVSSLLIIVILSISTYFFVITNFEKQAAASSFNTDTILELINGERKKAKLEPLKLDPKLITAANKKAEDMSVKIYFDHYSPAGKRGLSFITDTGFSSKIAAENLAVLFSDSQELVDSWMNSPTHKKNILNPDFEFTGIGIYPGTFEGYKTNFVVQFFADGYTPPKTQVVNKVQKAEVKVVPEIKEIKPEIVKEPTAEEKEAILKLEQKRLFEENFEITKRESTNDIQNALKGLNSN